MSTENLATWTEQLGSEDREIRAQAARRLRSLGAESLPAIKAHIQQWREEPVRSAIAFEELDGFREQAERLDPSSESVDLADGVLPHLEERRGRATRQMAERIFIVRALENMISVEAGKELIRILARDYSTWQREMRRAVDRQGTRLLPALLAGRSHPRSLIRRWSHQRCRELGRVSPGEAVQEDDPRVLAEVLRAYGMWKRTDAMEVIVSFVDSRRRLVRSAARWAIAQYGGNAIWKLRLAYRLETDQSARRDWDWQRLSQELYATIDRRRVAAADDELAAGLAAAADRDFELMHQRFSEVLRQVPDHPRASELANGYAAAGHHALDERDVDAAYRSFARALALVPDHSDAPTWRAALTYAHAEQHRRRGIVDAAGYQQALEHDEDFELAASALARYGDPPTTRQVTSRRIAGTLGAVLLLALGVYAIIRRRRPTLDAIEGDADPIDDATLDTLPG